MQGPSARHLARRVAELLLPQAVFAFQRSDELEPLLSAFSNLKTPEVHRVVPAEGVVRKPPAARATRRAARFAAALEGASEITLSLDAVAPVGDGTRPGQPPAAPRPAVRRQLFRCPRPPRRTVRRGALYVVVGGDRWNAAGLAVLEGHFRTKNMTVVPAGKFAGLLVGLISDRGALLDIGLIAHLDLAQRVLTVLTPCRRPAAIAQVWLGTARLRADGKELSPLRPGEI